MPRAKRNKKPKQKKKKSQLKPKTQAARIPRMIPNVAPMVHSICALNDPFCKHAIGAKYFDGGQVRTISVPQHLRVALSTNAAGECSFMFSPSYVSTGWVGACAGGVATYTTGPSTPPLSNTPSGFRVVSSGIIIRKVVAPLSASGMMRIRTFNSPSPNDLNQVGLSTYLCNDYTDVPLNEAREVCVSSKRVNDVQARTLVPPYVVSTVLTSQPYNGWTYIQVAVEGGPASLAVLDIECFVNYEVTLTDQDSLALLALPSPPGNPKIIEASTLVSSESKAIVKEGIVSFGKQVAGLAAKAALNALGMRLGIPRASNMLALTVD